MSSKINHSRQRGRTVAFRLTVLYAALFAAVSLSVLLFTRLALASHLHSELDRDLDEDIRMLATLYEAGDRDALVEEFLSEASADGVDEVLFALLGPEGELLASSDLSAWPEDVVREGVGALAAHGEGEAYATIALPGGEAQARLRYFRLPDDFILCMGESLAEIDDILGLVSLLFAVDILVMVLAGSAVGWFVARRAMAGVVRVTEIAKRIGRDDLDDRVTVGNEGAEIEELALAFNRMLSRISILVQEMKEVTDNIAHDLRSPITRLRGVAETTLTGSSTLDEYRDMAAVIIEESDYMTGLIDTLLEIAENTSGLSELRQDPVDLVPLLENAADLFQPLADKEQVGLQLAGLPAEAVVTGDASRLQRVVANLLDNAVKYTPAGGQVTLHAWANGSRVGFSIADTGCGIKEEALPYVFDRFYRGDASRSTPGNGLGLSLCQSIVRTHGGEISVASTPGHGATFTVLLTYAHPERNRS